MSGFNLMYPSAKRLDTEKTIAELFNILVEGNPTPQLQAAASTHETSAEAEAGGPVATTGPTYRK